MYHFCIISIILSIFSYFHCYAQPLDCISQIYCQGELLELIQRSGLFQDSKTFVDMPTKRPEEKVIASFRALPKNASLSELHQFINDNFDLPGSELDYPNSTDWKEDIELFSKIQDSTLLDFAKEIHLKWKNLVRQVNFSRLCHGCVSSHLNLKHPFVVPGGRFREFYYWDTFWILEGLLISEMWDTAKGVILNFLDIIDQVGYIPNGSRIYYLNRSQPPLLVHMVKLYIEYTNDYAILSYALPLLDREYIFWMTHRSLELNDPEGGPIKYQLNIYKVNNSLPRPESYMEDIHLGKDLPNDHARHIFYENLASAAESGWDFSSKWYEFDTLKFQHPNPNMKYFDNGFQSNSTLFEDLTNIHIISLVPLDLNAIMFSNEKILATFHSISTIHLKSSTQSMVSYYSVKASLRYQAMKKFLWSSSLQMWSDYNFITRKLRNEAVARSDPKTPGNLVSRFYISDFSPVWYFENYELNGFEPVKLAFNDHDTHVEEFHRLNDVVLLNLLEHIESSVQQQGGSLDGTCLWSYPGGIPISEIISGQQWDFPNAWAPIQYYIVSAFMKKSSKTEDQVLKKRLKLAALEVAQRWIRSTYCGWKRTGHFFEKYNVLYAGIPGEGGEYVVQDGFGWTNAVILKMLQLFGNELKLPSDCLVSDKSFGSVKSKLGRSVYRNGVNLLPVTRNCLRDL